jgi:predicted acyl esterase
MRPGSGPELAGAAMIVQRDLPVPMDDGLVLRADVFRPDRPGRFPVIMSLGPNGKGMPFASEWFGC